MHTGLPFLKFGKNYNQNALKLISALFQKGI